MARGPDSNVEVKLKNVRLAFEHIFKAQVPKPDKDGKIGAPSFNANFIIDKDDKKQLYLVEDAIEDSMKAMWGDKPPKIRSDRKPLKDGNDYEYDGYPDNWILSARNQKAPRVVHSKKDEDGFIVLDGSEGVIYSGCYVNAVVRIWCQDSADYGKRVNCSLEAVQFYADGDAFSGASRVDANAAFDGMEGKVDDDEDIRGSGRRRTEREAKEEGGRDRDRSDRGARDEDSRGRDAGRARDRDEAPRRPREEAEDRPRRGRDDDGERPSRGRGADDRDERPARGKDRDAEDDRAGRRAGRDDEDRASRGRDRDVDERSARRGRDEDEDAPRGRSSERSSRDREEPSRSRSSRDDDDVRPRRARDDADDRPRRSARDHADDLV